DRGREQQDVAGVAVANTVCERDVPLTRARRETRAGADPLYVPKDRGHLGVVGEAEELGHQRHAGPAGRGDGPGAGPARSHDHAYRRELVLGLDDGVRGMAVGVDAQLGQELPEGVYEAGRRGDRVPGGDADAPEHGAEGSGLVARHEDQALGGVHGLHDVRVDLVDAGGRPRLGPADHVHVAVDELGPATEVVGQRLLDDVERHAKQVCDHPDVGHVRDVVLELALDLDLGEQVLNGYRVVGEVGALGLVLEVCVVDAHAAGRQAGYVRMHRRRVEGDEELGWPAGDVALPADADVVPGRLALDVRREDVLPVHGDPHLEERSQEGQVRCLAARAVGGRYCDREVVHHQARVQADARADQRFGDAHAYAYTSGGRGFGPLARVRA